MPFESNAYVPAPREQVWSWLATPGVLTRLTPGFIRMRVLREADSLRDGYAILAPAPPSPLPSPKLAPRWVAAHDPAGFVVGESFVDAVTSAPYRQLTGWRHEHQMSDARRHASGAAGTQLIDVVHARVPDRTLGAVFRYRTQQLTDDLAAARRMRQLVADRRLTIAVTGASGLVGTQLVAWLRALGQRVILLVRREGSLRPDQRHWNPSRPEAGLLDGVDVVVHLAGASIAGRFTPAHKAAIRNSRVTPTRLLARLAASVGATFVSASAVGFYGADRGEQELAEDATGGNDFLAQVVRDWEQAAAVAAEAGVRTVCVRTGLVLSSAGGMLSMLLPLFRAGLGGRLGSGRQWYPWITLADLVDVYATAVFDDTLAGPINAVAPGIVRNTEFTRTLGGLLHRPTVLAVPKFAPAMLLGKDGLEQLVAANQRVVARRLAQRGHVFRYEQLADALTHELGGQPQ